MVNESPVHVELRGGGWAVVREGNERATSVYSTQSEAAEAGLELARQAKTEFYLHAQDGRVREHRNYGEGSPAATPEDEGTPDEETNNAEEVGVLRDGRKDDAPRTPEELYAGYEVYDRNGERIGKPHDIFVDEDDNPEYVGVWTEPSGSRSVLVPAEVVTAEDASRRMVISQPKSLVDAGPSLGQGEELTPGIEERVRRHYGLQGPPSIEGRGGYGAYYEGDTAHAAKHGPSGTAPIPQGPDVGGRQPKRKGEELRVRRSEEELKVGTREREAGAVRVRKRVRTDRERIVVPKKRVEVTVERVPVAERETAHSEIGEDEIVVPIIEEEVVVEKRPVVKEELRIRKEVVEEAEVVEEDVRREEIEVDDQTERHDG
jgi:uncharacterized protein (TIGR02271 family)